jgi:hypothetical protein
MNAVPGIWPTLHFAFRPAAAPASIGAEPECDRSGASCGPWAHDLREQDTGCSNAHTLRRRGGSEILGFDTASVVVSALVLAR